MMRNIDKEPVVQIANLNQSLGKGEVRKQILFNIHLRLMPGEIVIMTGPSGSGKSTLLTLIGALRTVEDGELFVFGENLNGMNAQKLIDIRRKIGFIFQAHNLFDALTAIQNVKIGLELHPYSAAEIEEKASAVLQQVGLGHRISHKPQNLSGGQRQRVAIARAIVNNPRLILADEPTAALDKESGREVVTIFQRMRDAGATILLVTHDNRILDAADRIVNMVDGNIVSDVDVKRSMEICEFITKCSIFEGSSPEKLVEVAQKMKIERFPANHWIFQQGEIGDKFYVVRQGSVEVIAEKDGLKQSVATFGPGDFFGEIALLKDIPRTASIVAREDVEVYSLSKQNFLAAIQSLAPFHQQLLNVLFHRH
jgi:putative ABC transport system ATP-binding protein